MFLVVSCTKLKNGVAEPALHFDALPILPAAGLASEWLRRAAEVTDCLPARCRYAGGGWRAALRAQAEASQQRPTQIGIISAGFGWLDEADVVPCYSATFASGPDQVGRRVAVAAPLALRHRAWWATINETRGLGETPLSDRLSDVKQCVVAIGTDYVHAVADDLQKLGSELGPERLILIAIGADPDKLPPEVARCRLPLDARLESVLPGARSSLNQRTLLWLVREIVPVAGWDRAEIERIAQSRLGESTERCKAGKPMADIELTEWIRSQLASGARLSNSALLRSLREEGSACGQKRFCHLAEIVREAMRI